MEKTNADTSKPRSRRLLIILGFLILPVVAGPALKSAAEWAGSQDFIPDNLIDPSALVRFAADKAVDFLTEAWKRYRGQ